MWAERTRFVQATDQTRLCANGFIYIDWVILFGEVVKQRKPCRGANLVSRQLAFDRRLTATTR